MDDKELKNKVNELEAKIVEVENNWKRALADYKNLERRVNEEKDAVMDFANLVLISQLIPVVDNLELLQQHSNDTGIKMIVKEFKQILKNNGLEEINPINEVFNPDNMEAVETKEGEPNKVLSVEQKGYILKNKLIRPARVIVGQKLE